MCLHTKTLALKRNAVVCVRESLATQLREEGPLGPLNKELSRQENFYDWQIDQWQGHCPVCESLVYSPPEYMYEVEAKYENRVCEDVLVWGKALIRA